MDDEIVDNIEDLSGNNASIFEFTQYTDDATNLDTDYDRKHHQNDAGQLDSRNNIYTEILKEYYKYIKETLESKKEDKKSIIYTFLLILLVLSCGFMCLIIHLVTQAKSDLSQIVALITAFGGFMGTILVIPTKISDYMFNTEETNQIGNVIKNIQDYDSAVRDDFYKNGNSKHE